MKFDDAAIVEAHGLRVDSAEDQALVARVYRAALELKLCIERRASDRNEPVQLDVSEAFTLAEMFVHAKAERAA